MLQTSILAFAWSIGFYWSMRLCSGTCVSHVGKSTDQLLGDYINICQRVDISECSRSSGKFSFESPKLSLDCAPIDVDNDGIKDGCGCVNNNRLNLNFVFVVDSKNPDTQNFSDQLISAYYENVYSVIKSQNVQQKVIYPKEGLCWGIMTAMNWLEELSSTNSGFSSNNIIVLNFNPLKDGSVCQGLPTFRETGIHTYMINFFESHDLSLMETKLGQFDQCTSVVTAEATEATMPEKTFNEIADSDKLKILTQMVTSLSDFLCFFSSKHSILEQPPIHRVAGQQNGKLPLLHQTKNILGLPSLLNLPTLPLIPTIPLIPALLGTPSPTRKPTTPPTRKPTVQPTQYWHWSIPSQHPTQPPTQWQWSSPTQHPTDRPTSPPTKRPTSPPTKRPTAPPTKRPTAPPTKRPTAPPTKRPTAPPTRRPTKRPTAPPTKRPTAPPTKRPTVPPTRRPTKRPTAPPTKRPTAPPTKRPTAPPTKRPTSYPTKRPTTKAPTKIPTAFPTQRPTTKAPTRRPTTYPTRRPTKKPTRKPTRSPTDRPTAQPTQWQWTESPTPRPTTKRY